MKSGSYFVPIPNGEVKVSQDILSEAEFVSFGFIDGAKLWNSIRIPRLTEECDEKIHKAKYGLDETMYTNFHNELQKLNNTRKESLDKLNEYQQKVTSSDTHKQQLKTNLSSDEIEGYKSKYNKLKELRKKLEEPSTPQNKIEKTQVGYNVDTLTKSIPKDYLEALSNLRENTNAFKKHQQKHEQTDNNISSSIKDLMSKLRETIIQQQIEKLIPTSLAAHPNKRVVFVQKDGSLDFDLPNSVKLPHKDPIMSTPVRDQKPLREQLSPVSTAASSSASPLSSTPPQPNRLRMR